MQRRNDLSRKVTEKVCSDVVLHNDKRSQGKQKYTRKVEDCIFLLYLLTVRVRVRFHSLLFPPPVLADQYVSSSSRLACLSLTLLFFKPLITRAADRLVSASDVPSDVPSSTTTDPQETHKLLHNIWTEYIFYHKCVIDLFSSHSCQQNSGEL